MADPGERPNEGPKGRKNFLETCTPPLSKDMDDRPPLLISRSGSGTVILQYVTYVVTLRRHGRAEAGGHKEEHILLLKVH